MQVRLSSWVGGQYVDMIDVLRMVGHNRWSWRMEEFEGVFKPGSDRNAVALEARLVAGDDLLLSWSELMSFAEDLHQMIWGKLVALGHDDFTPVLTLDCLDSTAWELSACTSDPAAIEALARVGRLWPTGD